MSDIVVPIRCHGQYDHRGGPARPHAFPVRVVLRRPSGLPYIMVRPECPHIAGPKDEQCALANWHGQTRTYPLTGCPYSFDVHVGESVVEAPSVLHTALHELVGVT